MSKVEKKTDRAKTDKTATEKQKIQDEVADIRQKARTRPVDRRLRMACRWLGGNTLVCVCREAIICAPVPCRRAIALTMSYPRRS